MPLGGGSVLSKRTYSSPLLPLHYTYMDRMAARGCGEQPLLLNPNFSSEAHVLLPT